MHVGNRYGIHNIGADVRPLALRVSRDLVSGEQTEGNGLSLQNQTGEPWEVHELKFYMRPQSNTSGRASGGFVQAALQMDSFPITDAFVPTWAMSPANALDLERLSPNWATWDTAAGVVNTFGQPMCLREDGMYYWNLDHPLYVPPGSAIKAQFNHTGLDPTAVTVGLTASGRVLPNTARPKTIRVPWISCWQSRMYEALTAYDPEQSKASQLNNPFGVNLQVERFVGRIAQRVQYIGTGTTQQSVVSDFATGPFDVLFRVRQLDSSGNVVVKNAGGFRNVYGARNRAWNTRFVMKPGAYQQVTLEKVAPPAGFVYNPGGATKVVQAEAQAQISLIGWREETL